MVMETPTRIFDILTYYKNHYAKPVMVAGKAGGAWTNYSTDEFLSTVEHLSKGLVAKRIGKGDKIALMSPNRPEWNFCDFAINQKSEERSVGKECVSKGRSRWWPG